MSASKVSVSTHPVLISKVSALRSSQSDAKAVRLLTAEIATFLAYEATHTALSVESTEKAMTPLGAEYDLMTVTPVRLCLVPILRSGLGLTDSFLAVLPASTEVHHLGLFREENTLNAVEYYNKLPQPSKDKQHVHTAFIVDPIIATGNTACAAIQILKEWGVKKIIFSCVLASKSGLERVSREWPAGVEIFVGCVDEKLNDHGYIVPGLGDIGDRLFQTSY